MNNSFGALKELKVNEKSYQYFDITVMKNFGIEVEKLPNSLKVLLENLLRNEDGKVVTKNDILSFADWLKNRKSSSEINFHPARVLMQDFTGVPAVVDLAAMRDAMKNLGGDTKKINPLVPVDLVIDHSVSVEKFGTSSSFKENVNIEYERNNERYKFLKWGQAAFNNFRVVPPGTGICHQVNLENLAQVVWTKKTDKFDLAYCDTVVGTDSHTTMINGLSVLGWGVGGIEAEAAMLGQAVTMLIPEVIGFKLDGKMPEGTTATDLVLVVVEMLRKKGVVGKFVEFYGTGLNELTLADRATLANMAPEYGATCGFFPIDSETIDYLRFTGRDEDRVALVEAYAKKQGLWASHNGGDIIFTDTLSLDLSTVVPAISGPKRPQDRILLNHSSQEFFGKTLAAFNLTKEEVSTTFAVKNEDFKLQHGNVVIAAITSCTNTSNPSVMLAAGLLAQKAVARNLKVKPWVKTSLAPGSQVVSDYLLSANVQKDLDTLGFNTVGYGCTTCIGNSGPLNENISESIKTNNILATSVLSGNRNFEGRISPDVKANYLASPPLVVAYALTGTMTHDFAKDPIGYDEKGAAVYLKDIWPTNAEIKKAMAESLTSKMFKERYAQVFKGDAMWQAIPLVESETFTWNSESTYVQNPPYFTHFKNDVSAKIKDIEEAFVLAQFGDSVTTDHISPAGSIKKDSPAGAFLQSKNVATYDFNSYGARRGNHEVMMRGTFANIRIKNEAIPGIEGGMAKFYPTGEVMPIYDAAMKYAQTNAALVIVAGKEYGTGSSRDWAAKGTRLLGVRAVITESFERIHRSNLIGMGVLPLEFTQGESRLTLGLDGTEKWTIRGLADLKAQDIITAEFTRQNGEKVSVKLQTRIDTASELDFYFNDGILPYVLKQLF